MPVIYLGLILIFRFSVSSERYLN